MSLSMQRRLMDEGHEVLVYIAPLSRSQFFGKSFPQQEVGDGIVRKEQNLERWKQWGHGGIYFFDSSHYGDIAESLRKRGELVFGSGTFCDKLEDDRSFGNGIAQSVGMKLPKSWDFKTIREAVAFLEGKDEKYYFKTDKYLAADVTCGDVASYLIQHLLHYVIPHYGERNTCLLQESISGVGLSTARYWNGRTFVGPYEGTIEHKAFMDKDIGGATGCSFNYVWLYSNDETEIVEALHFQKLEDVWRKNNAPPGIYDINAQISEDSGEAYFLEWTPRLGYDAEPTAQKGISNYGDFISRIVKGGDVDGLFSSDVHASVRLSLSPYPFEHIETIERKKLTGHPIMGTDGTHADHFIAYGLKWLPEVGLCLGDPGGLVGLSSASGRDANAFDACYNFIDQKLKIKNLQYRTDAKECVIADLRKISALGYSIR